MSAAAAVLHGISWKTLAGDRSAVVQAPLPCALPACRQGHCPIVDTDLVERRRDIFEALAGNDDQHERDTLIPVKKMPPSN